MSSEHPHARVLVIVDEPAIVDLLSAGLRGQGFDVAPAPVRPVAVESATSFRPDVLILDLTSPATAGFALLSRLRGLGITAPALFLVADEQIDTKITGLTLGGDDYVTKPFGLEEVIARLRVILRRAGANGAPGTARLVIGDLELDEDSHEVWKAGSPVALSPTEFTLLRYFMLNPDTMLSKVRILDHVWRYDFRGDTAVVESYVSYLRRKVDTTEPKMLYTKRGSGYILRAPKSHKP